MVEMELKKNKSEKLQDELLKTDLRMSDETLDSKPNELFAWCAHVNRFNNCVQMADARTYERSPSIFDSDYSAIDLPAIQYGTLQAVADSKRLIWFQCDIKKSATLNYFDVSNRKASARLLQQVYFTDSTLHAMETTFNAKRRLLGAVSVKEKIIYHLFNVTPNKCSLLRKNKCHPAITGYISDIDFDASGEHIVATTKRGICSLLNVDTNQLELQWNIKTFETSKFGFESTKMQGCDSYCCRLSKDIKLPIAYYKTDWTHIGIFDIEAAKVLLKTPMDVRIQTGYINSFDVSPMDSNILVVGGEQSSVFILDRRSPVLASTMIVDSTTCIGGLAISGCMSAKWNSDATLIGVGFDNGKAALIDPRKYSAHYDSNKDEAFPTFGISSVCFV